MRAPVELEVFADILCPFTHVGLRRLVEERTRRGAEGPALWVRAWPLELVNGAPMQPLAVAEKVAALRRDVAPDLFEGFDPQQFPATSLPALRLAAAAYRIGLATGEVVSLALRSAVFESGLDIADPQVLADLSDAYGVGPVTSVDAASVDDDWAEGSIRGVVGSPHFFLAGRDWFCPTLTITRDDGVLHITRDEEAFQAFTREAFGDPGAVPVGDPA